MKRKWRIACFYIPLFFGMLLPVGAALAKEPDSIAGVDVQASGEISMDRQKLDITGFEISATEDKAVKLSWDLNIYANRYQIYRADSKAGEYKLVKTVDQPHAEYVDTDIEAKKKYFYKMKAVGVFGNSLVEGEESRIRPFYNAGFFTPRILVKKGKSGAAHYIVIQLIVGWETGRCTADFPK